MLRRFSSGPVVIVERLLGYVAKESRGQLELSMDYLAKMLKNTFKEPADGSIKQDHCHKNKSCIEEPLSLKEDVQGTDAEWCNKDFSENAKQAELSTLVVIKNFTNEQSEDKGQKLSSHHLRRVKNPIQPHEAKKNILNNTVTDMATSSNHMFLQPIKLNLAKREAKRKQWTSLLFKDSLGNLLQNMEKHESSQKLTNGASNCDMDNDGSSHAITDRTLGNHPINKQLLLKRDNSMKIIPTFLRRDGEPEQQISKKLLDKKTVHSDVGSMSLNSIASENNTKIFDRTTDGFMGKQASYLDLYGVVGIDVRPITILNRSNNKRYQMEKIFQDLLQANSGIKRARDNYEEEFQRMADKLGAQRTDLNKYAEVQSARGTLDSCMVSSNEEFDSKNDLVDRKRGIIPPLRDLLNTRNASHEYEKNPRPALTERSGRENYSKIRIFKGFGLKIPKLDRTTHESNTSIENASTTFINNTSRSYRCQEIENCPPSRNLVSSNSNLFPDIRTTHNRARRQSLKKNMNLSCKPKIEKYPSYSEIGTSKSLRNIDG